MQNQPQEPRNITSEEYELICCYRLVSAEVRDVVTAVIASCVKRQEPAKRVELKTVSNK